MFKTDPCLGLGNLTYLLSSLTGEPESQGFGRTGYRRLATGTKKVRNLSGGETRYKGGVNSGY